MFPSVTNRFSVLSQEITGDFPFERRDSVDSEGES